MPGTTTTTTLQHQPDPSSQRFVAFNPSDVSIASLLPLYHSLESGAVKSSPVVWPEQRTLYATFTDASFRVSDSLNAADAPLVTWIRTPSNGVAFDTHVCLLRAIAGTAANLKLQLAQEQ